MMLSELSFRTAVVLVGCVCFSVATAFLQGLSADASEPVKGRSRRGWVLEAERLIAELRDLARETPRQEESSWSLKWTRVAKQRIADRLLWRLWLVTGMPPLLEERDETFGRSYLQRNVVAYQEYVATHNGLTFEEVCRLGLDNAVESFGSPLWYMTVRYLREKAGVESDCRIVVHSTPSRLLTVCPMNERDSSRQSAAFARWLKDNKEEVVWVADENRFRPRNGKYVGTDELFQSVIGHLGGN